MARQRYEAELLAFGWVSQGSRFGLMRGATPIDPNQPSPPNAGARPIKMLHKDISLDTHGWELESAVERRQQNPATFHIPKDGELRSLEIGDRVQLLFLFATWDQSNQPIIACERMWVTILSTVGDNLTGLLESAPRSSNALQSDDTLSFQS